MRWNWIGLGLLGLWLAWTLPSTSAADAQDARGVVWTTSGTLAANTWMAAYPKIVVFKADVPDDLEVRFEGRDAMPALSLGALREIASRGALAAQAAPTIVIDLGGTAITVAPPAKQIAALEAALDRYNQTSRRDEPAWTLNQWVRSWIVDRAAQAVSELREREKLSACATFQALTATEQKIITDKLGGSPCASP